MSTISVNRSFQHKITWCFCVLVHFFSNEIASASYHLVFLTVLLFCKPLPNDRIWLKRKSEREKKNIQHKHLRNVFCCTSSNTPQACSYAHFSLYSSTKCKLYRINICHIFRCRHQNQPTTMSTTTKFYAIFIEPPIVPVRIQYHFRLHKKNYLIFWKWAAQISHCTNNFVCTPWNIYDTGKSIK